LRCYIEFFACLSTQKTQSFELVARTVTHIRTRLCSRAHKQQHREHTRADNRSQDDMSFEQEKVSCHNNQLRLLCFTYATIRNTFRIAEIITPYEVVDERGLSHYVVFEYRAELRGPILHLSGKIG